MNSSDELSKKLEPLLIALIDGELTDEQVTQLRTVLREDPAARKYFAQTMFVHGALAWHDSPPLIDKASTKTRLNAFLDEANTDTSAAIPESAPTASLPVFKHRITATSIVVAAVFIGLIITTMAFTVPSWFKHQAPEDQHEFIAQLTHIHEAVWADGQTNNTRGAHLPIGQHLELKSGRILITYGSGAQVFLVGPSQYKVLGSNRGHLELGSLVGRVTVDSAQGFTVETPFARVEDQGTEFGIEVDESGTAEVLVLKGKVDFVRESSGSQPEQRVTLTKDQSASIGAKGGEIARHGKDVRLAKVMRKQLTLLSEVSAAGQITINNPGFEAASGSASNGNLANVIGWTEENPDSVYIDDNKTSWKPKADRALYLSGANAAVSQDLKHSWSSSGTYTLGIVGIEPQFRIAGAGDAFSVQLRETDGTVLWDSGSQNVDGTVKGSSGSVSYTGTGHVFNWQIAASTFERVLGATAGSQLNIRILNTGGIVYLDDVSLFLDELSTPKNVESE